MTIFKTKNLLRLALLLLCLGLCVTLLFACNEGTGGGNGDGDGNLGGGNTDGGGNAGDDNENNEDAYFMGVMRELLDFTVTVEEGKTPVVLHITDTQIIDASQQRYATRLGEVLYNYWLPENKEARCYGYLRELITKTKPDLILLTGDVVYGEFDDNGSALTDFIAFMESFGIPWAPVFGNHENESAKGVAWQCAQLEGAEHCLFKRNTLTGNGNYSVGLVQGGKLLRTFVMLDANGCSGASEQSLADGQMKTTFGFAEDQITWCKKLLKEVRFNFPETKITFAFHAQLPQFNTALSEKGYEAGAYIERQDGEEGDFGYVESLAYSPMSADCFATFKSLGCDSVLVGHIHTDSYSVVYEGVRLQYGQKSSTYDRINYVNAYGEIEGAYYSTETPLVGGTVMPLAANGDFKDPYIYLCEGAGGDIDWDGFEQKPVVAGLDLSSLNRQSSLSLATVMFEGTAAYRFTVGAQGKLYLPQEQIGEAQTLSFRVFIPAGTPTLRLNHQPELALQHTGNGETIYLGIGDAKGLDYTAKLGMWQDVTVELYAAENPTEFSFIFPANSTIYLSDVTIE